LKAGEESSAAPFPGFSPGVEECWMELDGARMRYLRTVPRFPLLAKDARNGAPLSSLLLSSASSEKVPLILLHGLLGYSFSWRFTMPALAPYATVYAPDMMGAGFSDRPAGIDHSMRGTAKRLLRFIGGLGISSFDLLGTSHGGAVATMAAAECLQPSSALRVRRLILVAPVNPYSSHGQKLAPFFGSAQGAALFRLTIARIRLMFSYWHARMYGDRRRIPPGTLEGYMAPLAKPGLFEHALSIVRTWTADLRELEDTLPKLAGVPTLLMWGSKDGAVYASSAEPLKKYFHDSKLIIFPGVGHLPYEECPEEFNRALIDFLTSNAAAGR
jgi:pimeloyl-ACP methyl ester carboxylesterase